MLFVSFSAFVKIKIVDCCRWFDSLAFRVRTRASLSLTEGPQSPFAIVQMCSHDQIWTIKPRDAFQRNFIEVNEQAVKYQLET